jgi:plastocyanin
MNEDITNSNNNDSSGKKRKSRAIMLTAILVASVAVSAITLSNAANYFNTSTNGQSADAGLMGQVSLASPSTISPTKREFTLIAQDADLQIAPGEIVRAWTFNGTIPGPTLRYTEGDNVTIHFINKTPLAHTVHFHGNHDELNDGVNPQILPGQNYTYNFIADPAGAFMYHCHAYPTSLHIRMGMYGAIIVDPKDSTVLKPAREFALVLSEFDPKNQDNFVAKYYPVNGYADQYMDENALQVRQNELVRLYVINIGTTIPYSFHLHSTIFKVYQSGLVSNTPIDAQTIELGPGNAAIVEASWKSPGTYMFHSHGFLEERGNMGSIHVSSEDGSNLTKSISMIESQYNLQKALQNSTVIEYDNLVNQAANPPSHDHSSQNDADAMTVNIVQGAWDKNQKLSYDPAEITVKKGSTITWQNDDNLVHSVTSKSEGLFDSSLIASGQQWQHQFDKAGEYDYYCIVHPWMEGGVKVTDG